MKVTKDEIVDMVLENIKKNGRCLNNKGECKYYHFYYDYDKYGVIKNENTCAIGLFAKDPEKMENVYHLENCVDIENRYGINIDELLQEQYQGHKLAFWEKLQCLHDTDDYWFKDGITLNDAGQSLLLDIRKLCEHV